MPLKNKTGKRRKYCKPQCANAFYNAYRKREECDQTEVEKLKQKNHELKNLVANLADRWELLNDIGDLEVKALMNFVERQFGLVVRLPHQ